MPKVTLFSYIVASDTGLAPNPFHGVCTLAYCKPKVRGAALEDDYVVGLSPASSCNRVVYAMRVTTRLPFAKYSQRYPKRETGDKKEKTKAPWALISTDFVYWGGDGPHLPDELADLVTGRGHKSKANEPLIPAFRKWFNRQKKGRRGDPAGGRKRKKC